MITLEEYRNDPCGTLSVPYWKWKGITLPDGMLILHHRAFVLPEGYRDEVYFRLRHDLRDILIESLPGVVIRRVERGDYETITEIVRRCYPGIRFETGPLTRTPVYAPELWLIAEVEGRPAGCIIADLDREAREGVLEWVQVLPEYRRRGIGRVLVLAALGRMDADFATVSGQTDNPTNPEMLYRACGFTGSDLWHILRKK